MPWRFAEDCPKCGEPLVIKLRRDDRRPFLSCSAYPACEFSEAWEPKLQEMRRLLTAVGVRDSEGRQSLGVRELDQALKRLAALCAPKRNRGETRLAVRMSKEIKSLRAKLRGI